MMIEALQDREKADNEVCQWPSTGLAQGLQLGEVGILRALGHDKAKTKVQSGFGLVWGHGAQPWLCIRITQGL